MKSKIKLIRLCVFMVVVLLFPGQFFADSWEPSHSCSKPYKPYQFDSQWELDSFMDEVENYKRCIESFIEEQKDAIRVHQSAAAADDAIDEWNNFVNYELN